MAVSVSRRGRCSGTSQRPEQMRRWQEPAQGPTQRMQALELARQAARLVQVLRRPRVAQAARQGATPRRRVPRVRRA